MNDEFEIGEYDTEDEAAFAYNVAACVLEGPNAKLNKGLKLTAKRKLQIEREVLKKLVPQIGQEGFVLTFDADTGEGRVISMSTLKVTKRILLSEIQGQPQAKTKELS